MSAALASRILAAITKHGGVVTFPGTNAGGSYNEVTGVWTPAAPGANATGRAIQKKDDPERFQAMGLTMANAVTLLVAAEGLTVTPAPGMAFQWAGKSYTAHAVEPMAPQGTPLYYELTGGL
jgi:hypothetical protein